MHPAASAMDILAFLAGQPIGDVERLTLTQAVHWAERFIEIRRKRTET